MAGRPRIHNREEIEALLVEVALKPETLTLLALSEVSMTSPDLIAKWARQDPDGLGRTLEWCKAIIGKRREEALVDGKLINRAYEVNKAVYDRWLRDEERDEMAYEHSLKTQSDAQQPITINLVDYEKKSST